VDSGKLDIQIYLRDTNFKAILFGGYGKDLIEEIVELKRRAFMSSGLALGYLFGGRVVRLLLGCQIDRNLSR
jgi:hypothetical protein